MEEHLNQTCYVTMKTPYLKFLLNDISWNVNLGATSNFEAHFSAIDFEIAFLLHFFQQQDNWYCLECPTCAYLSPAACEWVL